MCVSGSWQQEVEHSTGSNMLKGTINNYNKEINCILLMKWDHFVVFAFRLIPANENWKQCWASLMWVKLTFSPQTQQLYITRETFILYTHRSSGLTRLARGSSETLRTLMDNNKNNRLTQYLLQCFFISLIISKENLKWHVIDKGLLTEEPGGPGGPRGPMGPCRWRWEIGH